MSDGSSFNAGWYPDPTGGHEYRYYDGSQWTEHVSDAGSLSDAPISTSPPPLSAGEPRVSASPEAGGDVARVKDDAPRSRRNMWILGLAGAGAIAAVVVLLIVALGGDGGASQPLLGTYATDDDDVTISLTVAGDPAAVSELDVKTQCGGLSISQSIEFAPPRPIEEGRFDVFVPGPGELILEGVFVDGGERVRGDVSTGDCSWQWEAEFIGDQAMPEPEDEQADADMRPTSNAVIWQAPDATLTADNFYVEAGGLVFTANVDEIEVDGNPLSGGVYATIEVIWTEHDREMRYNLYLDSFQGDTWGSDEFRVYDGTSDPDWVTFEGRQFEVPIGDSFRADVIEFDNEDGVIVHFDGLVIDSNLRALDDEIDAAPTAEPPAPAVGPRVAIGDQLDVGDLTIELAEAYFRCFQVEGVGVLCPADLSPLDQPLTIELVLLQGDQAEFAAGTLVIELVDRDGQTYQTLSGLARDSADGTSERSITFGLPQLTDELELTFSSGERFDLAGGLPDDATSDDATSDDESDRARVVLRDDFDGSLDADWEWLNEDQSRWSLDDRPGWLSIVAQDAGPNGTQNMLVRPIPELLDREAGFFLNTQVAFEPTSNFQFAGLMIGGADPDVDRLQLGHSYCDADVCILGGLYFDRIEDGSFVGENKAIPFENRPEVYLRLGALKVNNASWVVLSAYSFDGVDWNVTGTHFIDFEPQLVGLIAGQAPDELLASFQFFELRERERE